MKRAAEELHNLGSELNDHQQIYPEGGAGAVSATSVPPGNKTDRQFEGIRRMWSGGPLRQFSNRQLKSHYVAYSSPILKGYAGSYLCDACQGPCQGRYRTPPLGNWVCGACKEDCERRRKELPP